TAPPPLTAPQLQASLDADSVLLQYALGDARSFVWVVTRTRLVGVELANRATIEDAARRALESLQTFRPDAPGADRDALARLAELTLLPVAAYLDKPRVVLALDGALQYVPFGVLPTE